MDTAGQSRSLSAGQNTGRGRGAEEGPLRANGTCLSSTERQKKGDQEPDGHLTEHVDVI